MERVKFDVSGHVYAVNKQTLSMGPDSKLKTLSTMETDGAIIVDRPPEAFGAMLAMYQTGELHIPVTSCPGAFLRELQYWDIARDKLSKCCYFRLQRFLKEQDTLHHFQERIRALKEERPSSCKGSACRAFGRARQAIWTVVDNKDNSCLSKIYFIVSVLMMLVSIFTLAFSTDQSFQRPLTNCERLQIMQDTGMEGIEFIQDILESYCDRTNIPVDNSTVNATETDEEHDTMYVSLIVDSQKGARMVDSLHDRLEHICDSASEEETILKSPPPPKTTSIAETFFNGSTKRLYTGTNISLPNVSSPTSTVYPFNNDSDGDSNNKINERSILFDPFNNGSMFLEDADTEMPPLAPECGYFDPFPGIKIKRVRIPNPKIPSDVFKVMELIIIVYFSVDLFFRLLACPCILRYFMSVVNVADALALLGSLVHVTLILLLPRKKHDESWVILIQMLQMFRSFRLFRVVVGFNISKVLAFSLVQNIKDLLIMCVYLFAGMCIFSTFLYIVEDKETIKSIPSGMYWAIVTMTTVGYGDIVPKTRTGRFIGSVCAISGVMVFALAVPLVVNHFITLYQYADFEDIGALGKDGKDRGDSVEDQNKDYNAEVNRNGGKEMHALNIV